MTRVWLSLFALDGCMNLLHVLGFAVVHSLPDSTFWSWRIPVHFASFGGAGGGEPPALAGAGAAPVALSSCRACD